MRGERQGVVLARCLQAQAELNRLHPACLLIMSMEWRENERERITMPSCAEVYGEGGSLPLTRPWLGRASIQPNYIIQGWGSWDVSLRPLPLKCEHVSDSIADQGLLH